MTHSQPEDSENYTKDNVSLEEIKASATRLADDTETEDSCIICLQSIEDRTVLINCAHDRMCFECIKKWTEQSRRCPLCNTPIGSHLIHRIRSEYDYQKFFLEPLRTSPPPVNIVAEARAGYRARTRRPSEIEQDNLERAIEKRRWVYRHGLFAKHVASNAHTRFRPNPTPAQITNSPELQSRCQMFVRRELRVWPNLDVEFLTSFILSLAKSIDIRTESAIKLISEFLDINRRPSPSGGTVAEHFTHEFYSYLRSPFRDLPAYDAVVQYDTPDDIEAPPPTAPRSNRQTEAGPSRSRHDSSSGRYEPEPRTRDGPSARRYDYDDPLDASPRDVDQDSELDMDEHWIEVPPSRRDGPRRGGESGRRDSPRSAYSRSTEWDREASRRERESTSRYREAPRQERQRDEPRERKDRSRRDRDRSRDRPFRLRKDRSRSLGRDDSLSPRREDTRSRRERSPTLGRDLSPLSRDRSPASRTDKGPMSTRDIDGPPRKDEERRRHESRSPSPTRDRKGKRRADDYGQWDKKERDWERRSDDQGRGRKGKDKEWDEGMRERGAQGRSSRRGGNYGDEGMPMGNDENRRDNDAEDNEDRKGRDDDERGSALSDDEAKTHRRFSRDRGSSRSYEEQYSRSNPDQQPWNGDYRPLLDKHPRYSHDRPLPDDHPYEEQVSYKSRHKTSHEHVRHSSHEPNARPSKRTRSPSPKSKRDGTSRDQKRPAVHSSPDDSRSNSSLSANTWSYDVHGAANQVQRPRLSSRGAQTCSRSQRRPAYQNVQEPKTPDVERSSTAHQALPTPFGLTSPEVDHTLLAQPEDNRDKPDADTKDKTRTDNRNRAPRLTPLASIRAHLQGPSRPSDPLNEGLEIKGSPARSTNHPESGATNYDASASGSTLLPNAVERSSTALNDPNTNPIHANDGSSVSYSILGAAARSQVQPPLITASPNSTQRVCPNSTVGRNRLLHARLEAIRATTNSDASHLSAKSPASPTLPDTTGNQSATNTEHDDHEQGTSQIGQLGADPADVHAPAAQFQVERRLKLQARLAARKREINAVMGAKSGSPL
ncbi:unnamed protein product [Rhizoctonia solani]|uniref:RING-type E3 ubiquitin transferase n=1 Tax=Rhizoctonia solani TaxID=456999 RepID=A0A8H2XNR7_9AGAM|nr:unnamed protein product [Rhizoctonia solani]